MKKELLKATPENPYDLHVKGLKYDKLKKEYDELKTLCDNSLALCFKTKAQRDELLESAKYYMEGISHFYNCVSFKKCFLDAKAITFMNEVPLNFIKSIKSIEKND